MSQSSHSSSRSQHGHRNLPPLQPNDSRDVVSTRLSGETQLDNDGDEAVPVYDSPATYSTQAASPPRLATLRTRKTKTPATGTPQSAQAIERQLQRKQTHIENRSIKRAFQRSVLHILPILVTSILFVLCTAEVYMGDLDGFPGQDVVLQAFQFVVKAHEILMTMSLGDIVLHRIRYDLIVHAGVPFGLLTSAYQLGDLGYLFSAEFHSGCLETSLPRSIILTACLELLGRSLVSTLLSRRTIIRSPTDSQIVLVATEEAIRADTAAYVCR